MADVAGQAIVRGAATFCLVLLILAAPPRMLAGHRAALILLLSMGVWISLQLIPLPPSIWLNLPGRAAYGAAATIMGEPQPWRPLALVPSGAANALASLLVPATMVALLMSLNERERAQLPTWILIFIAVSAMVGLVQTTSVTCDNPLINDGPGEVSGNFANRNHFALLMSLGCVLAPVWAAQQPRRPGLGWRTTLALGLIMLFILLILISGSRAGLFLGALGATAGGAIVFPQIRSTFRAYPRWVLPMLLVAVLMIVAGLIALSLNADRAFGIDRALAENATKDLRLRAMPAIIAMARQYFPVGIGAGAFDPIFRVHEPFNLLQQAYLNHAHNDFLEIVLEHGIVGAIMLVAGAAWWLVITVRAWRQVGPAALLARGASAMLVLIGLASSVDYPARTPIIMALLVVIAGWAAVRNPIGRDQLPPAHSGADRP
ncbi:MAG: hypothetical protein A4S16_05430 [Proteobacteria bacterium SG_bin6]|nr:MAG: hypothetical protein A4S16_05430 [Proteobacteria bacterium SG_bin6]